jgi:hypothetical protein
MIVYHKELNSYLRLRTPDDQKFTPYLQLKSISKMWIRVQGKARVGEKAESA